MKNQITLLLVGLSLPMHVFGELLIAAPPIAPKIEMERSFRPFVRELSKTLDERVRYIHADTWLDYSRDLRGDKFDITLSEAHVLSLALLNPNGGGLGHEPLTAMDGETAHYLISNKETIIKPKQLAYKNICVKPSPSLDSVQLYRLFSNPISQPNIVEIRGSYEDIGAAISKGKCVAMVAHTKPSKNQLEQHIIYDFSPVPQIGWSMTSRLPLRTKTALSNFFQADENQELINTIFQTVSESPSAPIAKPYSASDYKGLDKLLSQVWGW